MIDNENKFLILILLLVSMGLLLTGAPEIKAVLLLSIATLAAVLGQD